MIVISPPQAILKVLSNILADILQQQLYLTIPGIKCTIFQQFHFQVEEISTLLLALEELRTTVDEHPLETLQHFQHTFL